MTVAVVNALETDRGRVSDPGAMRVVLIQADRFCHERIRAAFSLERDMNVVAECSTFCEAGTYLDNLDPDIVIADVDLADGSGLAFRSVFNRLSPERVGALIVISAEERHAFTAFEAGAIDFLRKPLSDDRLHDAIERARTWIRGNESRDDSSRWGPELRATNAADAPHELPRLMRLAIRVDERVIFVRTPDVDYFEGSGNYVKVHVGEHSYRLRVTLSELAERLEPRRFRRIHRSFLVNIDRIKEVQQWFGGDHIVIMNDARRLRVSRTYARELLRPLQ